MKKLISAFLISTAFFACGPLPQEQEAESAVGITAPDGYSVACISGFVRRLPHFCVYDSGTAIANQTASLDSTCHSFDLSVTALPISAKAVAGRVRLLITSTNVVTFHQVSFIPSSLNTCGNSSGSFILREREEVAVVANTSLIEENIPFFYLPLIEDRKLYYVGSHTGGLSTLAELSVTGYYD